MVELLYETLPKWKIDKQNIFTCITTLDVFIFFVIRVMASQMKIMSSFVPETNL